MRNRFKIGALAILLSGMGVAHADSMTGATLRDWIASNDGALHLAASMYIVGVSDDDALLQVAQRRGFMNADPAPIHVCPARQKAKGEELRTSVARFIDEKPEYRKEAAVFAVRGALSRDYPCAN
ncbi:Rap1a/Tai family immunity protein [Burkholderia multivorans]|uniref:Rap1a/Tai family immunity protein n=1 Tax=Burkholderia multivorans TaxID=87883 RepID=UPI0021BFD1C4|nr:Rap1a/Tai family immunity protein [Burkholderia multivorans]